MDKPLPFIEHTKALRKCFLAIVFSLTSATIIVLPFTPQILRILKIPARGYLDKLFYFSPEEGLLVFFHVGLFAGIVISFPLLLYFFWQFISPALDENFKKKTAFFIFLCFGFFLLGCFFAYFLLLPGILRLLFSVARDTLTPVISADKYISFVTVIIVLSGLLFQMPIAVFILARLKLVSAGLLRRNYKNALVIIMIAAALITPTTDIFNMLALALPMVILYEMGIWVACFAVRRRKQP